MTPGNTRAVLSRIPAGFAEGIDRECHRKYTAAGNRGKGEMVRQELTGLHASAAARQTSSGAKSSSRRVVRPMPAGRLLEHIGNDMSR